MIMKSILILMVLVSAVFADSPKLKDTLPIFQTKCAPCHRGPFLDFTTYPFFSDIFTTPQELMFEVRLRILGQKKAMPPVNAPALTEAEKNLILGWIDSNMPEIDNAEQY